MPKKQTGTSFVGGGNLAVFKDAKNRDGAWKFVQWLSRPEVQARVVQTLNDLPAVEAAWEDGSLAADPNLKVFGEQLKDAKAPPAVPTWEQVAAAIDTELEKICRRASPAEDATKAIQSQAASIGTGDLTWPPRPPDGAAAPVAGPGRPAATRRRQPWSPGSSPCPSWCCSLVFMAGPVLASLAMSFTDFAAATCATRWP